MDEESYKKVKNLLEEHEGLLINPFEYDGIIHSSHMLWVGTSLNQQVTPAIVYSMYLVKDCLFS